MNLLRRSLILIALLFSISSRIWVSGAPVPSISIGLNFNGSTYSAATPADPDGVVGPRHFVEFINGAFAIYNKTSGVSVRRVSDAHFWSTAGITLSASDGIADPRIVFDPVSQRWFASMVDFDASASDPSLESNDFLLAVSATSDPTGAWHGFQFQADPDTGYFADFPTLGLDSNAVYLSGDMYQGVDNPLGAGLVSIPKADLLASTPTIDNRTWFGVMNYAQRGQVLQPVNCFDGSASGKILAAADIGNDSDPHSNIVSFAVQNAGGPGATLSASTIIRTAPWVVPDNDVVLVPQFTATQPDGTTTLQANDARLSAKVSAVGGVLYAVNNTELNNHIAIRWYRIRASDNVLLESGTIADPDLDLFFPSIAANANGVVVIAFNGSGLATTISCFAMAGQTLNGVTSFGSRLLLQAGLNSYHDINEQIGILLDEPALSRWGDYNTVSVDPSDPNRFWTIQMYPSDANPDNNYIWSTRITELVTTSIPFLTINKTGINVAVSWPTGLDGFQLQSATNLIPSIAWSNVTQIPQTNGAQVSVLLPASAGRQFFRLKK